LTGDKETQLGTLGVEGSFDLKRQWQLCERKKEKKRSEKIGFSATDHDLDNNNTIMLLKQ
jgi:hypothetical protein